MRSFIFLIILVSLSAFQTGKTQNAIYLSEGSIEFEKKVHTHARLEKDDMFDEAIKKTVPKFRTTYHNLFFRGQTTLYKPGRAVPVQGPAGFGGAAAEDNIVYSLLDKQLYTGQKEIFDQRYLVADSTRKIKWKITTETRMIAGFECRRANALFLDSVYIVAYYTDAILTRGGPESVSGLPGMILGLAIPSEHITWFATKVTAEPVSDKLLVPPSKGKQVTYRQLLDDLKTGLKDWGDWAKRAIMAAML
ncbi:GLPGLI family protein [Filimonas effusa]|uniref:GLPGLI family protein n=1 Tax=Filimonas effusa TaxID=2508721 RepID=A0A4Q1D268_9BACT|nr:GLPGLI family protein [Filimonas effusa]RXK81410.1 GLPGLI family protein [Filimonas effusa]